MFKKIQIIIFFFLPCLLVAQNYTISGYVQDIKTGEKLIGAYVYDKYSKTGTSTNSFGYYSLSFHSNDSIKLIISYTGYNREYKKTRLNRNTQLNFNLKSDNLLQEISVHANKTENIHQRTEMSIIEIPIIQIKNLPALAGEVDIMKAIQLMPGVKSGNEGSSGLYVRGGSPDQNLILLDDVPLYYVNHLGGFVSIFNADAINNFKLIKGGFPAKYGSRLSSILDIRMKDGNNKKFQGQGTIGLISSKLSIEGPVIKDTSSYIISVRRCLYDLITRPLTALFDDVSLGYTFYDINAKFNYKFSDKNKIYFSFYKGDDKIMFKEKEKDDTDIEKSKNNLNWGNMLGSFRWNHLYNQKLFSNVTLNYTKYRYKTEFSTIEKDKEDNTTEYFYNAFYSGINDVSAKIDYEYFMNNKYKLKFGANFVYHTFTPGIASYKHTETNVNSIDTSFNNQKFNALENAIYLENIIKFNNKFKTNFGIRISNYSIENKAFYSFEPRILINYLLTENLSVKSSFSTMKQYIHLLSYSGIGMPSDLWVPATKNVLPENSYQFTLGVAQSLINNKIEFSVETYYKYLDNLISFKEGASFLGDAVDWQKKVETNGKGKSYGIELLLQKKEGRLTGWLGYTLSKTTRQFNNLNSAKTYPFRYDRRHDIGIAVNYKLNNHINISGTWVYGTGNAITLPVGFHNNICHTYNLNNILYNSYNSSVYIYGSKNSFRMRAFHKLDVGINFYKKKKWGERTWNISIYNVYNRKNPYYYFFKNVTENNKTEKKLFQQSFFPIIPSVSYSFKF